MACSCADLTGERHVAVRHQDEPRSEHPERDLHQLEVQLAVLDEAVLVARPLLPAAQAVGRVPDRHCPVDDEDVESVEPAVDQEHPGGDEDCAERDGLLALLPLHHQPQHQPAGQWTQQPCTKQIMLT